MKPRRKLAIAKAEKPDPTRIQTGFTLDERDALDRATGRIRALLTAVAYLHTLADHDVSEVLISEKDEDPTGWLVDMARENMRIIEETFDAADARRNPNDAGPRADDV
jgi:hypothetical protein